MTSQRHDINPLCEAQGKFYYDLAKLTFGGIVIGEILMLQSDLTNVMNWITVAFGGIATGIFATIAKYFYKESNLKQL